MPFDWGRVDRLWDERREPKRPCPCCHYLYWWRRKDGGWVCGMCHPDPSKPAPAKNVEVEYTGMKEQIEKLKKQHMHPGMIYLREKMASYTDFGPSAGEYIVNHLPKSGAKLEAFKLVVDNVANCRKNSWLLPRTSINTVGILLPSPEEMGREWARTYGVDLEVVLVHLMIDEALAIAKNIRKKDAEQWSYKKESDDG